MKTLTLVGTVMSTATLIAMSAIGVGAYNSTIVLEEDSSTPALTGVINASIYTVDEVNKLVEHAIEYKTERDCLAQNIYHEAMGESELGQRAVAYATINRTKDDRYPTTICEVVHQAVTDANGQPLRNKCQFSWYCDGKSDEVKDEEAYAKAVYVASVVINTYGNSFDPTMGATMYHTDDVNPKWKKSFAKTTEIENHIFYRKE